MSWAFQKNIQRNKGKEIPPGNLLHISVVRSGGCGWHRHEGLESLLVLHRLVLQNQGKLITHVGLELYSSFEGPKDPGFLVFRGFAYFILVNILIE